MMSTNDCENYGQNSHVRISILDNDFCMIMDQNENDEVSKYKKFDKLYPNQHDVSAVYGLFKCQENIERSKFKVTPRIHWFSKVLLYLKN